MEACGRSEGLIDYIAGRYGGAVEIGIGHAPEVAFGLLEKGLLMFATDIQPFSYGRIHVIVDDITAPDLSLYKDADLIYSIKPPPELVPYMKEAAKNVLADLIVRPLAAEFLDGRLMRTGDISFYIWKRNEED